MVYMGRFLGLGPGDEVRPVGGGVGVVGYVAFFEGAGFVAPEVEVADDDVAGAGCEGVEERCYEADGGKGKGSFEGLDRGLGAVGGLHVFGGGDVHLLPDKTQS